MLAAYAFCMPTPLTDHYHYLPPLAAAAVQSCWRATASRPSPYHLPGQQCGLRRSRAAAAAAAAVPKNEEEASRRGQEGRAEEPRMLEQPAGQGARRKPTHLLGQQGLGVVEGSGADGAETRGRGTKKELQQGPTW